MQSFVTLSRLRISYALDRIMQILLPRNLFGTWQPHVSTTLVVITVRFHDLMNLNTNTILELTGIPHSVGQA